MLQSALGKSVNGLARTGSEDSSSEASKYAPVGSLHQIVQELAPNGLVSIPLARKIISVRNTTVASTVRNGSHEHVERRTAINS